MAASATRYFANMKLNIRPERPADQAAVAQLSRLAFGQDAEARLVAGLRDGGFLRVSLVAEVDGEVVGHILFSQVPIITSDGAIEALSLAPMAVLPALQRKGIGTELVEEGLRTCREQGHRIVIVLGHPGFYPRFGFLSTLAKPLASAYSGEGDAWMALELVPEALKGVVGRVEYPLPFNEVT
jgi:putative acetyltransferase